MPDGPQTYQQIVLAARRRTLRAMPQRAQQALADTYARQLAEIVQSLAALEDGSAAADRARRQMRALAEALERYADEANVQITRITEATIQAAVEGHEVALAGLEQAEGVSLAASFDGVPERAMRALQVRTSSGLVEGFKTLSRFSARASAEAIEEALFDAVGRGESWQRATGKVARALVEGDEALEAAFDRLGIGPDAFGAPGAVDEEVLHQVRRVQYNARRIVVTEINTAFYETDNLAMAESPVVRGVEFRLSTAHSIRDICDLMAETNAYGLGAGVYPPGEAPAKPHPFCKCHLVPVFRPASEWDRPRPRHGAPRELGREEVARMLPDATEKEIDRWHEQLNTANREAHEHRAEVVA